MIEIEKEIFNNLVASKNIHISMPYYIHKTNIRIGKSEGENLELTFDSIDEAIKFVDMKYGLDNLFFY